MTIRDLMEQFTIQGAYQIQKWDDKGIRCNILAEGINFEDEQCNICDEALDSEITYMYTPQRTSYIVFEVE